MSEEFTVETKGPTVVNIPAPISLRDYFAAAAMQGMLAEDAEAYIFESLAEASYKVADAMLEARNAKL